MSTPPFSVLSAAERAAVLLDGEPRVAEATPTLWAGTGRIGRRRVSLAITDGHRSGGTIGVEEARALARLIGGAGERREEAAVVVWDTGGVRVQEGPTALAAAATVGVSLARLALLGTRVISVISGPRGCFGAPAVIAAASHRVLVLRGAHWGLTGPDLLVAGGDAADPRAARAATSAAARRRRRHASDLTADDAAAVRARLRRLLARPLRRSSPRALIDAAAQRSARLLRRLRADPSFRQQQRADQSRQRDFFRYSLHGRWRALGPVLRRRQVQAAWGEVDGRPVMGIIVGPERPQRGIGIAEAQTVTEAVRRAIALSSGKRPAPIVTFLFCRGHSNDVAEERAGVHVALAECLRSMVLARLLGHPLLCVLGGGAYGAAYLALAAPSHRIVAIRGTSVAPMSPAVRAAFERLRGIRSGESMPELAEWIPEIRIVDSVIRLPAALEEELAAVEPSLAGEPVPRRLAGPQ